MRNDDDDFLDIDAVRRELGGEDKPLSRPTVYRYIKRGIISPPAKVGALSRWRRGNIRADRARMIAAVAEHPDKAA